MLKPDVVNFGRNIRFQPAFEYEPKSHEEVIEILARHQGDKIRVVGSLHAWSEFAATNGVLISLKHLDSIEIRENESGATVTVGAGCQIKRLLHKLSEKNLTLPSLGLIDEQTVAGATATGTHGSGKNSLSHYVQAVSIAHYDSQSGEPAITVVDSGKELKAARCSLGLLGVVISITFRCRSRYNIQEHGAAQASLQDVLDLESEYPQQQFYLMPWSWQLLTHHRVETDKPRSKLASLYRAYCFCVIDLGLHIAIFIMAKMLRLSWPIRKFYKWILPVTIIRNWKVVDDSHAMLVMQHELFRHIEIEVFVQRSNLQQAISLMIDVIAVFGGRQTEGKATTNAILESSGFAKRLDECRGSYVHHYPICVRRVQADDTLISMSCPSAESDEDWYAISLISYQWPGDREGFFMFADFVGDAFSKIFGGRCHWGKYQSLERQQVGGLYPGMHDFREVIKQFDTDGVFSNEKLTQLIR